MAYTIFDDQVGNGTGDLIATGKTIEEAHAIGQSLLERGLGYFIFDDSDEGAPAIQFVPRSMAPAKACEEGAYAYNGIASVLCTLKPCPYPPGSVLRAAWINGWEQASERRREAECNILNDLLG